jgi:hypothetical protein
MRQSTPQEGTFKNTSNSELHDTAACEIVARGTACHAHAFSSGSVKKAKVKLH